MRTLSDAPARSVVLGLTLLAGATLPLHADEPLARPEPVGFCGTVVDDPGVSTLARPYVARGPLAGDRGAPRLSASSPCTEDGTRIDIAIVYTPAVLGAEGSLGAVQALADAAIAELNLVFSNSALPSVAVLSGLHEIGYTESGFLSTDLARLRTPGDGYMDEVHGWRNADRADLVCLIANTGDVLGIANLAVQAGYTPRPDLAFSVVQRNSVGGGTGVFAHEVGHNLGLLHNVEADPCQLAGADYAAHGYLEPGGAFMTLMGSAAAPRELIFSDPNTLVGGLPAGNSDSDNLWVVAQSASVASRFRDRDQNMNAVCDADEIAANPSLDCNTNGILDQFETDLNLNGSPDDCDIASGSSLDMDGDGVPDEAELARLYVDADAAPGGQGTSWADAIDDLQFAMALARASGDASEIWIAEGTYKPGPYKADTFDLVGGVAMLGGFDGTETDASQRDWDAHETILSGDLAGDDDSSPWARNDNSVTVCYGYGETGLITLDGLTITGGYSVDTRFCQSGGTGIADGGGVFALFCDIQINNCRVVNNAALRGGGLLLPDVTSWSLNDTVVENNRAIGEPVAASSAGAYLTAKKLPGNVTRCEFRGNISDGGVGGVFLIGGTPIVSDTAFVGNRALGSGNGGFYARLLVDGVFSNVTVAHNTGSGASFDNVSTGSLSNAVFWGNRPASGLLSTYPGYQLGYTGSIVLSSITQQYFDGTLTGLDLDGADPRFVDPLGPDALINSGDEDVRLGEGSGAIDTGDDSLTTSTIDLDGNPRFVGTVDRGAYEAQPPACPADINGDGILDNGDIGTFVAAFLASDTVADFNSDGILDNGDIGAFVAAFLAGC